jgi:hypothetical protein
MRGKGVSWDRTRVDWRPAVSQFTLLAQFKGAKPGG